MKELIEVTMENIISYSKQKAVPAVTIIDDLTNEQFNYVSTIADRLRLLIILVKETKITIYGLTRYTKKWITLLS